MAGTQSRAVAFIFTLLMIVGAIYLGGMRTLSGMRAQAIAPIFESSQTRDSLQRVFLRRAENANNLVVVAKRYLDDGDTSLASLEEVAIELEDACEEKNEQDGVNAMVWWNRKLDEAIDSVQQKLTGKSLQPEDQTFLSELKAGLRADQDRIKSSSYPSDAKAFNEKRNQGLARLLAWLTGVEPLEEIV